MRIVLVGQGPFGEKTLDALIQKGQDIVGVFCPQDKRGEAMKTLAQDSGTAHFQPNHMKDAEVRRQVPAAGLFEFSEKRKRTYRFAKLEP